MPATDLFMRPEKITFYFLDSGCAPLNEITQLFRIWKIVCEEQSGENCFNYENKLGERSV